MFFSLEMAVFGKLMLDILLITSIIGALGFIIFVKQKEIYLYTNIALLSVICLLYTCYLSSVRRRDFIRWLEQNRTSELPYVNNFRRKLNTLLSDGPPCWVVMILNFLATSMILFFPIIMGVVSLMNNDSTVSTICTVLAIIATFYLSVILMCGTFANTRSRLHFNGATLLLVVGVFLILSNYGILEVFIGSFLTFLGLWCHYNFVKTRCMDACNLQ